MGARFENKISNHRLYDNSDLNKWLISNINLKLGSKLQINQQINRDTYGSSCHNPLDIFKYSCLHNRWRHCEHISLTSLKENELLLILFCVQKMKNWLHETVFNFAAYYIFIKLGYYSNHSPLLNYVHSFGQHYRIDRFGH